MLVVDSHSPPPPPHEADAQTFLIKSEFTIPEEEEGDAQRSLGGGGT